MRRFWFWLRWSGRDLRHRWVQVAVIALVIAIGTGVYAALNSTSAWSRVSYDASYEALNTHDVRVSLPAGGYAPSGSMVDILSAMEHPEWVNGSAERLIVPTQVDASTPERTILVPGRLVGIPSDTDGAGIDRIYLTGGNGISGDTGAILEGHFASYYELPVEGNIELAGGVPIHYTGTGFTPDYFIVYSGQGDFLAQANFAAVFLPLTTVQQISGQADQVNDLLITLQPGVDRRTAAAEISRAFSAQMPQVGVRVETIDDDPAHSFLYKDLRNSNTTNIAIAILILLGAAFAAFNLTGRIVEAQRREIGIGMAMGVHRHTIALRPLLVGAEIAALGVVFGVGVGFLMGGLLRSVFQNTVPLPVWLTPFQFSPFAGAAAVGFLLPFMATAWPVWRAVRVEPVQAIQTGHLAVRGGGLAPLLKRMRLPGRSFAQMPVRNVMRAPRRSLLTILGIGAAIVMLVAILGSLDAFNHMLDRTSTELNRRTPDRVDVTLQGFQPADAALAMVAQRVPAVGSKEATVQVNGRASTDAAQLGLQITAQDLKSPIWHPTIAHEVAAGNLPGIVLSDKAAADLGLEPGDELAVTHPFRTGETTFGLRETRMRLIGIHDNPTRFLAFTDLANAELFGLAGFTNKLVVVPAPGISQAEVERAMFALPGVAFAQPPSASVDAFRDMLKQYNRIYQTIEGFVLLLALLIAFSAASINIDERRRENATMESFGVRVRTILRMSVVEAGIIGALGTLIGLGLGYLVEGLLLRQTADQLPEVQFLTTLKPSSLVIALYLGIVVTAVAPLFTARKLRRMDISSTLRVME